MNEEQLLRAELARRSAIQSRPPLWSDDFPEQAAFLADKHRYKALLCPRRSAKSYTAGLGLMTGARDIRGFNGLYISLTFDSARAIMWEPVIRQLDRDRDLGFKFNDVRLEAVSPIGGRFRLFGADATSDQIKKVLGGKFHQVWIDEAAMFRQDVAEMFNKYIRPALTDHQGQCMMVSTPSDLTNGFFYDVTSGAPERSSPFTVGEWKTYHWSPEDNPYIARQWREDHAALLAANPLVVNTPAYQQMWQGRWVINSEALVYRFSPMRDVVESLPPGRYTYVLGVDLGWNDATAFVVLAWNEQDTTAYVCHAESESHMDFTAVADRIKQLTKQFHIQVTVIDGASAQGVEEMISRHGLPLERAEKTGKADYQKLLNAELTMERLKLVRNGTQKLRNEWSSLIWDPRKKALSPPIFVEHPSLPNHCSDAALYAWRYTYTYASKRPQTADPVKIAHNQEIEAALERARRRDDHETDEETVVGGDGGFGYAGPDAQDGDW